MCDKWKTIIYEKKNDSVHSLFLSLSFFPDNSIINWLLFSLILATVSVLGLNVFVFSKYNYVTLKHLEYLVDLFSLDLSQTSSSWFACAFNWWLIDSAKIDYDSVSFLIFFQFFVVLRCTCTHTHVVRVCCIAFFLNFWIIIELIYYSRWSFLNAIQLGSQASLITKAKLKKTTTIYRMNWTEPNRISIQIQQINNHFNSIALLLHLKTISIFLATLQHQYNNLNGYSDIQRTFFSQLPYLSLSLWWFQFNSGWVFFSHFFRSDY